MKLTSGRFVTFCNVALYMTFMLLLTSSEGQSCVCPSCNYASATQNCQCCVFRQLGKRGDPATFTPDLSLPADIGPSHDLSQPISDEFTSRFRNTDRGLTRNWMAKRHPSFYYYYNDLTGSVDASMSKEGSTLKKGSTGGVSDYLRTNSKLAMGLQLGLLGDMGLDNTLGNTDSDDMYDYN